MDEGFISLEISEASSIPKYKQIVNSIINKIELGQIKYGQKLPSINRLSFDYYLARDTVEKAYISLKDRGIVESVKGKGYYVINSTPDTQIKVLVVFNKLSKYKQEIFNELVRLLGEKVKIDFFIHHCNLKFFKTILQEHMEGYSYYIIMPHFKEKDRQEFKSMMSEIPKEKIIMMDYQMEGFDHYHSCVYQDFTMDIYEAMMGARERFEIYKKLVLIFPQLEDYPYPKEIIQGFRRFCGSNNFEHEILSGVSDDFKLVKGTGYLVIDETDLIQLIKIQRASGFKLKKDVGILSYNETPLKEVLAEGISVITTDFKAMAFHTAKSILNNKPVEVRNKFSFIARESL